MDTKVMKDEELAAIEALESKVVKGPWLLTTINVNPRGLRMYRQAVRATDTGILGGLPAPKTTMQLQFEAYGVMHEQADGTPDGYYPDEQTKSNAAFIAAARSFVPQAIEAIRTLQAQVQAVQEKIAERKHAITTEFEQGDAEADIYAARLLEVQIIELALNPLDTMLTPSQEGGQGE